MKFVFAAVLLAVAVALSNGKSLSQPRTHGNFEPMLKNTFELRPQFVHALSSKDPIAIAKAYISLKNNFAENSVRVASFHTSPHNGVTHVYLQQVVNGLDVSNGVANVNVDKSGKILSAGNAFFTEAAPAPSFVHSTAAEAVAAFAKFLNLEAGSLVSTASASIHGAPTFAVAGASFALSEIQAVLKYIQVDGGVELVPVWSLEVEMKDNYYNAFVDANTGSVVSLVDWVSDATYNVFPLGINDPSSGERQKLVDPAHPVASPNGWHDQGDGETITDTKGNNVFAHENFDGGSDYINNYRPDGGAALNFDFELDLTKDPKDYIDAAVTNLFYWNNVIHDLFYVYGFNEESGNFQVDNLNRGGAGGDAVVAHGQSGDGTNNANFLTRPDGNEGVMRMYVWTQTTPRRDGDVDGGIVMHEYAHGISNRLTGGRTNTGCLGSGEPGGMGEGWGDFFATITRTTASSTREDVYSMGDYSAADPNGIRNYKYSTDLEINPSTYAFLGKSGYGGVHAKGEVWAVILYDVYWNLVDKLGFEADWFNTESAAGNVKFLQLVVDGLKLQPCSPKFVQARDAIIQADEVNNGGDNKCELWRGFAKRGLGVEAKAPTSPFVWNGKEDFTVPADC